MFCSSEDIDWTVFNGGISEILVGINPELLGCAEEREQLTQALTDQLILSLYKAGVPLSPESHDYTVDNDDTSRLFFRVVISGSWQLNLAQYHIQYDISVQTEADLYTRQCSPISHNQHTVLWQWGENWQRQCYAKTPAIDPAVISSAATEFGRVWHGQHE